MKSVLIRSFFFAGVIALAVLPLRDSAAKDVVRPEEIRSKREVIYDQETYDKLAKQWQDYYKEFPSEYAYANWMYAARYAGWDDYQKLLDKGLKKYPANPKLLYLSACNVGMGEEQKRNRERLERAVALDPGYMDPWFSLVGAYMTADDDERTDVALRRLYESGIVQDCIMDYNYNILIGLDSNAVLITNGDNDTYPGWILTRIIKIRPDVSIINRSLLNTDWYPLHVIRRGAPHFVTTDELKTLRSNIEAEIRRTKTMPGAGGAFGDTLIVKIIDAAQRENRPVYFAATLCKSPTIDRYAANARQLGLAALVTPASESYEAQAHRCFSRWLSDYRTGGLDSWKLRAAPESDASRMMMPNYAHAMAMALDALRSIKPDLRPGLFNWYRSHVEPVLNEQMKSAVGAAWCGQDDISEVKSWCDKQGYNR
jgi:hypothetical protein